MRTKIERRLFENDGAGPEIRKDIIPCDVDPDPETIPLRGPNGELKAAAPLADDDVVRVKESSYSFTEQLTGGYWTNGKKIYRKAVDCGYGPNATTKLVPHGITNIDEIVSIRGRQQNTVPLATGNAMALPNVHSSAVGNQIMIYLAGANISIGSGADVSAYKQISILEYTCTDR